MTGAILSASHDLVVALDYGHFYLWTRVSDDLDLPLRLLERAHGAGDGVGQGEGLLLVLSPHQNNFDMQLRVEVWESRPPDDLAAWEEAFEAHLDVDETGIRYESPTLSSASIDVPRGSYHALITGRGFVGLGWPGSTTPGDSWRIRLWPSDGPADARRLRRFAPDLPTPPEPVYLTAAHVAAARINADLNGGPSARALFNQTGTARVQRTFTASRQKLFAVVADLGLWSSAASRRLGGPAPGSRYWLYRNDDSNGIFDGTPTGNGLTSHVRATCVEVDEPDHIAVTWEWCTGTSVGETANEVPLLPEPTILHLRLHEDADDVGRPLTVMEFEHTGLPDAWVEDMTTVWCRKLEYGDLLFGTKYR